MTHTAPPSGREVAGPAAGGSALLERLLHRTHLSGAGDLPRIVSEEAAAVGASGALLYLADYEQTILPPVPVPGEEDREPLSVAGTLAGRAYTTTSIVIGDGEAGRGRRVWLPLLDGTDRLGVMELSFASPAPPSAETVAVFERYAHLVAMLLVSKGAYSDFFELVRRRQPMTGAAELLTRLTPPRVLATRDFVLGALMEPA